MASARCVNCNKIIYFFPDKGWRHAFGAVDFIYCMGSYHVNSKKEVADAGAEGLVVWDTKKN
ncbi:MAG: hypothetical protein ACYS6K_22835 [Planctomycetota bacterium]|jgi:hypothetical protein